MYLGPSQGKSQPPRVDLAVGPGPSARNTAGEAVLEKQGPQLCGVGLQLKKWKDGKMVVEQVRESGPAERVGIRPGDFLVSVDGFNVHGMDGHAIAQKICGPVGSRVSLGDTIPAVFFFVDVMRIRSQGW